ncbi:MAG: type IV pilus biogenesis/stability protein PilW [Proteobacteria bacterium]|nr:type IV pilus biogenesis/stability protein PilW [Pseudomonadota bacterium]
MNKFLLLLLIMFLSGCVQTSGNLSSKNKPRKVAENDNSSPAMINVRMGVGYYERGDTDTAIIKLKRALEHEPKLAIAHSAIALVYADMNAHSEAERHYKFSVKYAPNDPIILNNYGTFLCQTGKYKKAVEYYNKTLENPFYKTPETVHENAGVCLMKLDDRISAEKHFRTALRINPRLSISLYNMVIIKASNREYMSVRAFVQRLSDLVKLDERILKIAYEVEKKMGNDKAASNYYTALKKL